MYLQKQGQIPEAELDIMRVLWESGKEMSVSEIVSALSNKHLWKNPTATVLLKRLSTKGYISINRSSSTYLYAASISKNEYQSIMLRSILGGSVKSMVASLLDNNDIGENEISEIAELLEKKRIELKKD
ncbi:MAG: BlaI/MecI/CopY family transcriptional regulator [Clostridia bacterium]|nr:BlaI/MecI/CopY family transcriptional regulator [Clostridia bacterium]